MDWRDLGLLTAAVFGNGLLLFFIFNNGYKKNYRLVKNKKRELLSLKAVSRIINEEPQLQVKIDLVLDITQKLMEASKILLVLNNNLTSSLHGLNGKHDRILVRNLHQRAILKFISKKQPTALANCPESIASFLEAVGTITSCILFPVKSGNKDIALLCLIYQSDSLKNHFSSPGFMEDKLQTLDTIVNQLGASIERESLYEERTSVNENITGILSNVLDSKNSYTHGHCKRVAQLAVALGEWLGLGSEEEHVLNYGGLLHDLGKVSISDAILTKPGALTNQEYAEIMQHPETGARMLEKLEFFKEVSACIQYHHERYDGNGYPSGLKGEEIPLYARIIAVADAFDAMTSARSYGRVFTQNEAVAELVQCAGSQFDPVLVMAFVKMLNGNKAKVELEKGYCA